MLPKKNSAAQAPDPDPNVANVGRESEAHPAAPKTNPPANAGLPESAAPPALTNPSSLIPFPCLSNPELETPPSAPWPLPPDHSSADASPPATASENKHDKNATNAKRQRRQLRKMLRNQKHIFKAKKLVQNLTFGRQNPTSAAAPETSPSAANEEALLSPVPLETAFSDPWPLTTDHSFTDPWLFPAPEPCPADPPPDSLETRNLELETPLDTTLPETRNQEPNTINDPGLLEIENQRPKTENQLFKGPKPPPPPDETSRRADELFEISHGYKRNNPPPIIPNRRRDEDFRSHSVFGDVKNVLKYMLGIFI